MINKVVPQWIACDAYLKSYNSFIWNHFICLDNPYISFLGLRWSFNKPESVQLSESIGSRVNSLDRSGFNNYNIKNLKFVLFSYIYEAELVFLRF
jgi:hypothetical protein